MYELASMIKELLELPRIGPVMESSNHQIARSSVLNWSIQIPLDSPKHDQY